MASRLSPFLIALVHPLNLIMAGLAIVAGLLAAWWLFPVGVLFWLTMVVKVARDPSLRITHQMSSRAPLARRFQRYVDRLERAQVGVFNSLAAAPPRTRRVMQPVQAEIEDLVTRAHELAARMTVLENYRRVSQARTDLSSDLDHLTKMIEGARDPVVRREYEESRDALVARMGELDAASTQLDRVEAQLMGLTNDMDGIVAEVIRLQAMGQDAARKVPDLVGRIRAEAAALTVQQTEGAGSRSVR